MKLQLLLAAEFACIMATAQERTDLVSWSLGRNATREGDIAIVDTKGKRDGGAVHAKLDLGGMTGGVRATIRARGRGIGRPDKSYFGLKFMFHYADPETGAAKWPHSDGRTSIFRKAS